MKCIPEDTQHAFTLFLGPIVLLCHAHTPFRFDIKFTLPSNIQNDVDLELPNGTQKTGT